MQLTKSKKHSDVVDAVSKDLAVLNEAAMTERQLQFDFPARDMTVNLTSVLGERHPKTLVRRTARLETPRFITQRFRWQVEGGS